MIIAAPNTETVIEILKSYNFQDDRKVAGKHIAMGTGAKFFETTDSKIEPMLTEDQLAALFLMYGNDHAALTYLRSEFPNDWSLKHEQWVW